jgi:hypothetical protein
MIAMGKIEEWVSKPRGREILIAVIFILSVTASFALGYLYARNYEPLPIVVEKCAE